MMTDVSPPTVPHAALALMATSAAQRADLHVVRVLSLVEGLQIVHDLGRGCEQCAQRNVNVSAQSALPEWYNSHLLLSWVCLHRARHPSRPPLDTGALLRLPRYLLRIVYADSDGDQLGYY
jgi:hypothetical protein